MTLTPGTQLGSYEITSLLGSGGMGQVYRAKDLELGRDVAIKVLREELASDPERLRRFEQEARSASALNHPNIIHIYGVGKQGATPYIAMELVEGQTLTEMIAEGPLPAKNLLQLATQIAEGLAKAHSAGIIHRDLKPANLMVNSDGYVKILDFGLAKLLPGSGLDSEAATVTKEGPATGAVMGTAGYMSPEQALGKSLDTRTDVFSLGAVLYEMATGSRPFKGETLAGLFDEILRKTPPSPSSLNPELTTDLDRTIDKALEKEPGQRYPSAVGFLSDLQNISEGPLIPRTSTSKSIVVLPFENISPDPDNEYFSDGLTEEVIADLSQVPEIKVISRSSAMTLKGSAKTAREISRELNVQYVLEGSVRKSGNNLRITAQLIEATEDVHLWAKKYSGTLDDVFDIQEKVSRSIVDALKVKLSPEADQRISQKPIDDVRAYECYLRAQTEVMSFTEEGLERAQQLIRTGLEIAGESELLHAAMGNVYWQYVNIGFNPSQFESYMRDSEKCASKALALNPNSVQGHYVLGMVHDMRGNLQEAIREHKKALRIDPDNPDVLFWLALLYSIVGKGFASKPLAKRLLEVDPLSAHNYLIPGWIAYLDGNNEECFEPITKAYHMDPGNILTRWGYAWALLWNRQFPEAVLIVDSMIRDAPQNAFTLSVAFLTRALQGDKSKALHTVTPEFAEAARWDHSVAYMLAQGYAVLDEKNDGLDWLETATSRGFINYPILSEYDPLIHNLRGEERFKQIMKRVESEWEHFEV